MKTLTTMNVRVSVRRGFTLMEMMVAIAISGVITAAALMAFVNVSRATRRAEQQAHADEEAKLLVDYVMSEVQQAGGGQVRPWMGVAVDDNTAAVCNTSETIGSVTVPACNNADRLHVTILPNAAQCSIVSVTGGTTVNVSSPGSCCLNDADFEHKPVVLFAPDGGPNQGEWRSSFCTDVDIGSCRCTLKASDTAYTTPAHADADFAGGIIAPGTTWSFYLDNQGETVSNAAGSNPVLKVVSDDGTGNTVVTELQDHVQDLQVDLGFDTDGDQITNLFQPSYPSARSELRQLRVGVMVGEPVAARDTQSTATLSNGAAHTAARGMYMRGTTSTTTLRNLNIFF